MAARNQRRQLERAEAKGLLILVNSAWWSGWLHHSPNEGMDATARQLAASQGTRPGFPDYILPIRANGFGGLAFELKATKPFGKKETELQRAWLDCFGRAGWFTGVPYGAEEGAAMCFAYMDGVDRPADAWTGAAL
jgi:hypothetical protein